MDNPPQSAGQVARQIAVAIVMRTGAGGEDEFLVGRRVEGQNLAGCDEFPGGTVDVGELPRQAAVRECLEETGVRLISVEPFATVAHVYRFGELELHFFIGRIAADSPPAALASPRAPFRWVPRSKLRDCHFPAANESVLERLDALRSS